MEAKIKIVSESAEISMEDAQMALDLADGSVERALELIPYVEKSIVVIHGKFVCGKTTKLYGIFRLVGHGKEGQLLDLGLAMSYSQSDVENPITAAPEAFKKIVTEFFNQTETNQVHSFLAGLYEQLGVAQIYQIFNLAKEGKSKELTDFFRELIGRIWGGSERVEADVVNFLMTKVQAEKKGLMQPDVSAEGEDGEEGASLTIYLETEPMISPVKGKTIDKFTPNEIIPVKIVDRREAGRYLGAMLSNEFGYALGRFKELYFNEVSNRYQVTVEFGPKMYGRFVIEPAVRLATFVETPQGQSQQQVAVSGDVAVPAQTTSLNLNSNALIFLFMGIFVMFLLFFILLR